jgi:hypothetical protein
VSFIFGQPNRNVVTALQFDPGFIPRSELNLSPLWVINGSRRASELGPFIPQQRKQLYPRPDCLELDTEVRSADLNAQEIVRRFGLGATQNS